MDLEERSCWYQSCIQRNPSLPMSDEEQSQVPVVNKAKEDEEFGSFSDASFEEFEAAPELDEPTRSFSTLSIEDLEQSDSKSDEKVVKIVNGILGVQPEDLNNAIEENRPFLDERARALLNQLSSEPNNLQQLNWKQSIIRRQLFLNLSIPFDLDELYPRERKLGISKSYGKDSFSDSTDKLATDIPFVEVSPERAKQLTEESDSIVQNIERRLQSEQYYTDGHLSEQELEDILKEMKGFNSQLIELLSGWNQERLELLKDREISEGYLTNILDNTQKFRRQSSIKQRHL